MSKLLKVLVLSTVFCAASPQVSQATFGFEQLAKVKKAIYKVSSWIGDQLSLSDGVLAKFGFSGSNAKAVKAGLEIIEELTDDDGGNIKQEINQLIKPMHDLGEAFLERKGLDEKTADAIIDPLAKIADGFTDDKGSLTSDMIDAVNPAFDVVKGAASVLKPGSITESVRNISSNVDQIMKEISKPSSIMRKVHDIADPMLNIVGNATATINPILAKKVRNIGDPAVDIIKELTDEDGNDPLTTIIEISKPAMSLISQIEFEGDMPQQK